MAGRPAAEDLPDDVVGHVFSFLPTRDVVETCLLRKSWRYYWTTVPNLKFYSCSDSFVDMVVNRYKRQKVKKFHLDIYLKEFCAAKIDSWVTFAIDRQVEELLLNLNSFFDYYRYHRISREGLTLSPMLYNCSSLTSLSLRDCHFPPCEECVSWSSLKSLSIGYVDGDVLQKILMGSPVLEYLTLGKCRGVEEIRSMSLRELVIDGHFAESRLHISTPRLLSLRVRLYDIGALIIRIVEAPSLLDAALDFDVPTEPDFCLLKEMLCKLQNATRILCGPWCGWVMQPLKMEDIRRSLPNCKTLTLHVPIPDFSFPAIANMLAATPKLEKLVISFKLEDGPWDVFNMDSGNVDYKTYWQLKKKFRRWARHLRNVEIFGFYSCSRDNYEGVLMLIKFLLGHAFVLEDMVIKLREGLKYHDLVSSDKLHEVIRRLKCFHKASGHAAVILNYLKEEHGKRPKKGFKVTRKSMRI